MAIAPPVPLSMVPTGPDASPKQGPNITSTVTSGAKVQPSTAAHSSGVAPAFKQLSVSLVPSVIHRNGNVVTS